jgi:hypothetical protein
LLRKENVVITVDDVRNQFGRYFPHVEYTDAELKNIASAMSGADENGVADRVLRCLRVVSDAVCNRGVPIKVCFVGDRDLTINSVDATCDLVRKLGGVDIYSRYWEEEWDIFRTVLHYFAEGYSIGRRVGQAEERKLRIRDIERMRR